MMRSILPRLRPEKIATPPGGSSPHPVEKIGAGMHVEPPIGGRLRPPVVPGDAAQVIDQVRAERRMNPHQRRQPRIHLRLHQRGVEMTGIDDDEVVSGMAGEQLRAII